MLIGRFSFAVIKVKLLPVSAMERSKRSSSAVQCGTRVIVLGMQYVSKANETGHRRSNSVARKEMMPRMRLFKRPFFRR
jgi:hypothetical protein